MAHRVCARITTRIITVLSCAIPTATISRPSATSRNRTRPMAERNPQTQMPRWLLYGLIGKGVLVVLVVIGVLFYAGVI